MLMMLESSAHILNIIEFVRLLDTRVVMKNEQRIATSSVQRFLTSVPPGVGSF